jgi:hypothetical protein
VVDLRSAMELTSYRGENGDEERRAETNLFSKN